MTPKKMLPEISDPLSRTIVMTLLEEGNPLRNCEIVERLGEKRLQDEEIKKTIDEPRARKESLRVQVTNRLQRLVEHGYLKKNIVSPKNVQYSIADVKDARGQVDKEIFKQSLKGLRFQKVSLETEIEKITKEIAETFADVDKKLLLGWKERRELRDPAKAVLWKTAILEGFKTARKPCKIFLIYPTDVPMPDINKEDIQKMYEVFLSKNLRRLDELGKTEKHSFSILFQYKPLSSREEIKYKQQSDKACLDAWKRAMKVETLSKEMLSKYQQDQNFVSGLLNKSTEKLPKKLKK